LKTRQEIASVEGKMAPNAGRTPDRMENNSGILEGGFARESRGDGKVLSDHDTASRGPGMPSS